jgi:hypothetical protein
LTKLEFESRELAAAEEPSESAAVKTQSKVPQYNLAEQILSDQRRSVASRRKPVKSPALHEKDDSIQQIVKQYVSEASVSEETPMVQAGSYHNLWDDDLLTSFQRELLQEMIQRDISEYCNN